MDTPTDRPILGLHQHSHFSMLDGGSGPGAYVEFAKANELPAVGLTDHGLISGHFDLRCSCDKHGIKAIYGVEVYLLPHPDYQKAPGQKELHYFHLTLWALNATGYRNLSALASKSWATTHRNRPLVSWDDLSLYADGLACGSGCLLGPVAFPFIRGEKEEGVKALCRLREIFGPERLFLEIMPHTVDRDYSGRDGKVVSVMGEDGIVYRFDPEDVLETSEGAMTAAQAAKRRVQEIYGAAPVRVQDGGGLEPINNDNHPKFTNMNDDLGDRMKIYEGAEADRRMMPLLPTFARVDGRAFHTFTRGMNRPYDERMSSAMEQTARYLAKETNACMTYTQSDEITLVWLSTDTKSQIWFDGRHSKMVSQIAALATLCFYRIIAETMPAFAPRLPTFDARVWQVPNRAEGANVFLWRELDATKNSISMAAHSVYSNKELLGKNGSQKQEMLWQKGINWNNYPAFFKRGSFVQRRRSLIPFSAEEIDQLPEKHAARTNPGLLVERSEWITLELPPFRTINNREAVVFDGANYETANSYVDQIQTL